MYIPPPENLTVATTGASGSLFLKHFLLTRRDDRVKTVNFIASDSALRVMAEELEIEGRSDLLRQIIGTPPENSPAGERRHRCECGQRVISLRRDGRDPLQRRDSGRIANGIASYLIERAADVSSERAAAAGPLRARNAAEQIHIRNMSLAADAGATIFPLIPAFYYRPATLEAMAQEFANRVWPTSDCHRRTRISGRVRPVPVLNPVTPAD